MVFYDDLALEVDVILKFFTGSNVPTNKSEEDQNKKNNDQQLGTQNQKQSNKDHYRD